MTLELANPWPLIGASGVILLYRWHRQSITPFSLQRRRLSLALRITLLLLLLLAMCEPRLIRQRYAQFVYGVVDVSRSVGENAVQEASRWLSALQNEGTTGIDRHGTILFAGKAAVLSGTQTLAEVPAKALNDEATDIATALRFADASFPPGFAKTVLLFSDGRETTGNVAAALEQWKAAGIRIHTVPVKSPDSPEVLVRSVSAPRQVKEEEPFRIVAEVVSNRETEATLELFRNGPRVSSKKVTLRPGSNRFEMTQTVGGEKMYEFAVGVRANEDTIVDNNQASAFVHVAGKSKVLLLADVPESARYLARALRQEGILLDIRPATGAPTEMADLQNYDLVIFDNIPATDLQPEQMELMASYVRDFGGGFLMLGGEASFGLGGYYRTPIDEILPVRCEFEKDQENPSLGIVLVIDRSGSMEGDKIEMAKDAAKAVVALLSPKDYIGVIVFDNEAYWVCETTSAANKASVIQKISTIEAEGGTNMQPGMEMAFRSLSATPAKLKHVILMTDGMSAPGPYREIAGQMVAQQITLSTVAVGGDADQALLKQIAEWGNGRYYYTDTPQSIPQIFARETVNVSKSAIKDLPFLPVQVASADFLKGVDFSAAPFLLGYVTTQPKPTSEGWLVTERGEPLLSTWRYGLGQVGAFTSDARNRWAVEWLKWDGYGKFWAQLVRKMTRSAALAHSPSTFERRNGIFQVSVDCTDERGRYRSDLNGELLLLGPDGRSTRHPLVIEAPGRLAARWRDDGARGGYHAQLILRHGNDPVEQQYLSLNIGYPDEFLMEGMDEATLRTLSEATGGLFGPSTPSDLRNDRMVPVETELWPWLVGVALFLFVGDVASRRWLGNRLSSV